MDYIILHESAHEYWGNSVSCTDHAEMWIHEGFATYMENLYIEYLYGKEAALRYLESNKRQLKMTSLYSGRNRLITQIIQGIYIQKELGYSSHYVMLLATTVSGLTYSGPSTINTNMVSQKPRISLIW